MSWASKQQQNKKVFHSILNPWWGYSQFRVTTPPPTPIFFSPPPDFPLTKQSRGSLQNGGFFFSKTPFFLRPDQNLIYYYWLSYLSYLRSWCLTNKNKNMSLARFCWPLEDCLLFLVYFKLKHTHSPSRKYSTNMIFVSFFSKGKKKLKQLRFWENGQCLANFTVPHLPRLHNYSENFKESPVYPFVLLA